MTVMDWKLIDDISRHATALGRGLESHGRDWLSSEQASEQPLLAAWVAHQLHVRGNIDQVLDQLPVAAQHNWLGWLSHDTGRFEQAHRHFSQAWADRSSLVGSDPLAAMPYEAQIALGLGRTHLRSGHWDHARRWLLFGLSQARRCGDEATVYKSYGALGELFVRASAPIQGFACLNLAYRLLPAGSGQRARQLNYLGTALGRLQENLRAQSVLMTSYHMSKDSGDTVSKWHALARLQHLGLKCPPLMSLSDLNLEELADAPELAPPVARGYWALARARSMRDTPRESACTDWFQMAWDDFGQANVPMERAWAGLWLHRHTGEPSAWTDAMSAVQALMALSPVEPPAPIGILDLTLEQPALPLANAFEALLHYPGTQAEWERLDALFFV